MKEAHMYLVYDWTGNMNVDDEATRKIMTEEEVFTLIDDAKNNPKIKISVYRITIGPSLLDWS